jgi:sulfopyruvate decarboxylase subunit alpha
MTMYIDDRATVQPEAKAGRGVGLLLDKLVESGIGFAASLPDSWVNDVVIGVERDERFTSVIVNREESAIALCAGAFFAGVKSVAIMGTSGFMASIYAITKICYTYQIGFPIIFTVRGTITDTAPNHQSHAEVFERTRLALGIDMLELREDRDFDAIPAACYHSRIVKRPTLIGLTNQLD